MPAWKSSSLAFSDHNGMRHPKGLMKNTPTRVSKQDIVTHKMFGKKRKNIQIGKTFRKKGKGVGQKGSVSPKMHGGGISPSIEDFDNMMASIVKGTKGGKGGFFTRKQFG